MALAFAGIENHYFVNDCFFAPDQLLRDAHQVSHIPTVIVQGRYDMCTPAITAYDLHRALPDAQFVMVDDAGPGVPDDLRERLFEPFARGGSSQRTEGAGLGLAIAREQASVLGGELWVEGSPMGGARFVVRLPLPPELP